MIEFVSGRYVSQIWFLHSDEAPMDVLGTMWKEADGWKAQIRLRFYDGDQSKDAFGSGDTKRTYNLVVRSADEAEALRDLSKCFRKMADDLKLTIEALPVRTDDPHKIFEILSQQSWAHIRKVG